jgi:four helix bundle protein
MGNIAEGFGRHSDREFANFLNIAIGSAIEVQSHLYVALDQHYIEQSDFKTIYTVAAEVARMSKSLAQHLRNSQS